MAYLQQDKEDEEKVQGLNQVMAPQQGQPAPVAGTPAPTSAPSAAPSSATPAQSTQVNQKAGSGTFTNLKNYLTANQGNRISSAATQKVSNLATGAQKGIQQASTGFGQKVEQGTLANRGQAVQDVQATTAAASGVEEVGRVKTPEELAQAQQLQTNLSTIQKQYDDSARQVRTGGRFNKGFKTVRDETLKPSIQQAQEAASAYDTEQQALDSSYKPQYLDESQQKRFADIINAKYSGPESLRQSGLLQPAAEKVTTASRQIKNAETAGGREELLRSMFGKNRDYTQGQSKLDSLLLNTSQEGVGQLQQAAKAGGNLQQNLQQAEAGSQNLAQNRATEIAGIREQARGAFETGRTAEETGTEARMDALIKTPVIDAAGNPVLKQDGSPMTEWDRLPEHYRASLANKGKANTAIQQEQINKLETQYSPQLQAVSAKQAELAEAEKLVRKAKSEATLARMAVERSGSGPSAAARVEAAKNSRLKADQLLNAKKAELQGIQSTPEYQQYVSQKAAAEGMNMNQWALSPEEAAVLGIGSGEGLYNIGQGDIRTTAADREKLITQNEFARQQALAQLAGLDTSNGLQKELKYQDQTKAGTQDLTKSLDTDAFRNALNQAQQGFKQSAEGANLTGTGMKKVSRGNMWGTSTSTYNSAVEGNVANMLKQAGYDVGADAKSGAKSLLSNKDMLANYLGATGTSRAMETNKGGQALEGATAGAGTGAGIGTMVGGPGVGTGIGAAIGAGVGAIAGGNTIDPYQNYIDMVRDFEDKLGIKGAGAVAQAGQDIRNVAGKAVTGVGNVFGGSLGKAIGGIGSAVGGIDKGAMKEFGDAVAKENAIADLQRKYQSYLEGQGFENRASIADTETTRARTAALNQLLQRKG